mgnify:CR=1 FL=1
MKTFVTSCRAGCYTSARLVLLQGQYIYKIMPIKAKNFYGYPPAEGIFLKVIVLLGLPLLLFFGGVSSFGGWLVWRGRCS